MNPNQIFEDFDRKYQGSFVQVVFEKKSPELFQIVRMRNEGSKFPKIELRSDKLGTVVLNYNTSARVLFRVPQATYFQCGKTAVFFTRRPERQWKRGIHANNTSLIVPNASAFDRIRGDVAMEVSWANIDDAFNPQFFSLPDAINKLVNQEYFSVALSRNTALVKSKTKDVFGLYYRMGRIGHVTPTGEIVAPHFTREVNREIKR